MSLLFLFPTFVKSFPQWERFWHMCWYSSGAFASRDAISTRFSLGRWATMSLECCSISWGWSVSPWSFLLFSRRTGSCAEISVRLAPELAPYVRDQIPPVGIQFFSIIFFLKILNNFLNIFKIIFFKSFLKFCLYFFNLAKTWPPKYFSHLAHKIFKFHLFLFVCPAKPFSVTGQKVANYGL